MISEYGFKCSFNPTFPAGDRGWISEGYYGLDQGPIVTMIENAFSGLIWRLMCQCPYITTGLSRAGFAGGWLASSDEDDQAARRGERIGPMGADTAQPGPRV
jgi:hypothetical protein